MKKMQSTAQSVLNDDELQEMRRLEEQKAEIDAKLEKLKSKSDRPKDRRQVGFGGKPGKK